ncbi:alpha/beta hydrolase [Mycetohabitans sp. B8]|uniref:serine aminopeptidase domain-containing protein n=1 Tax=Mycetohabitans sp. B8 TaxID=2841845 RepID=UPI001F3DF09A|nr:alpha/beta hydrolase [Mycetohabitans sp. B8]
MIPITFDDCVGWLHEGRSPRGVVLCAAVGHEGLWTHKLMRALAERLAHEGIWALRFDYPCCGDSAGDDLDSDRFDKSIASIGRAVHALRAHAQLTDVTLVGLRAGAAMALLACTMDTPAAARVDALVALSPVVRGRLYMREAAMVERQWLDTTPPAVQQAHAGEPCLSVLGHRYPADFVAALRAIDLCATVGSAASLPHSVLLIDTDRGDSAVLQKALQARGVQATVQSFPESATTWIEGIRSRLPLATIEAGVAWIATRQRPDAPVAQPMPEPAASLRTAGAHLVLPDATESTVQIGAAPLIGTLCRPATPTPGRSGMPALLFATTASNPRSADARLAVRIARQLAAHGIASLRVDVSGVGDSGARALDDQSVVPYSEQAVADVVASADWLAEQGYRDVVALGICSGAYASLQAALRSTAVTGMIGINLPRFIWPAGLTLADAMAQQTNSARGYLASARDLRKWKSLLRRRRDLRPVVKALVRLATAKLRVPAMQLLERAGWRPPAHSERGMIHALARRGVKTLLIYGEFDPGLDELSRHFGPAHRAFRRQRQIDVQTIAQLDHSVYGVQGADAVIELCIHTLMHWSTEPSSMSGLPRPAPATGPRSATASMHVQ